MHNRDKRNRDREYLRPDEAMQLIEAAKYRGRHRTRDYALLLLMYRHGFRVTEALNLKWSMVSLTGEKPSIYIKRLKGSDSGTHPLQSDEVEALQALRALDDKYEGEHVFMGERGPVSRQMVNKLVDRCAVAAEIPIKTYPHILRHSCGYYLANKSYDTRLIQGWLGHRNIQHTVAYTKLDTSRYNSIQWEVV
jgi:type 1 fimbriae regulatory protein FimB